MYVNEVQECADDDNQTPGGDNVHVGPLDTADTCARVGVKVTDEVTERVNI